MTARTSKTKIQGSVLLMLTLVNTMPAGAQYMANTYSLSSVKATPTYSPQTQMSTQYTSQISPQPIATVSTSTATLSPAMSTASITTMTTALPVTTSIQPSFNTSIMTMPVTSISTLSSPLTTVNLGTLAPLTSTFQTPVFQSPSLQSSVLTSTPTFTLGGTPSKFNFNLLHVLGGVKGTGGSGAGGGVLGTVGGAVGGVVGGVSGAAGGAVSGAVGGSRPGCPSSILGTLLACASSGRQNGIFSQQFGASDFFSSVVSIVNAGVISTAQSGMQLSLFSSANQVLQGAKGQRISGGTGTMISHNEELVILHRGSIVFASGELPSKIQTRAGELALGANSLVQIDDTGKHIRVSSVSGDADSVCLRGAITNGQAILAKPGQELIFSTEGIEEEELISADGSVETVIQGSIEKRPTVARKTYVEAEATTTSGPSRAGRHVRLGNAAPGLFAGSALNNFDPRQAENWNRMNLSAKAGDEAPLQITALPGCQLESNSDGALNLNHGTVFLAPKYSVKVHTQFAAVEVKRNGLVMVEHVDGISRIKALSGPGDVLVSSNGVKMPLSPGQELLVADRAPSAVEMNPADAIARRARSSNLVAGDYNLALNDFSISSLLRYVGYRKMISSVDGKLLDRVMKIAAVVELVGRARGQYSYSALYQQAAKPSQAIEMISIKNNDKQTGKF